MEPSPNARHDVESPRQGLTRSSVAALAAIAFGITLGLGVVIAGVVAQSGGDGRATESRKPSAASPPPATPGADIAVRASHGGNLQLAIRARVSINRQPVIQAQVAAWTDMTAMPRAHRQGPIPMGAVPGRPGLYETRTKVPMVGEYAVEVRATGPVKATGRKVVSVGNVERGSAP